jgi:hypothetical protein
MKHLYKQFQILSVFMLTLITMFAAVACTSSGIERSEDLQTALQLVDSDIKLIVVQIDAIGASLDELIAPGQTDVRKAFDVFTENSSKIEKMEKDFSKHSDRIEVSGSAYFSEWDKKDNQYENPEIQKRSDERRAELGRIYDEVLNFSTGIKEPFQTYTSDIIEIQLYMSNDLTANGIASIAGLSNQTVLNGTYLKTELLNLQAATERAMAEMAQRGI